MFHRRFYRIVFYTAAILTFPTSSNAQVTEQQAKNIREAVPEKARVTPQKHRRVLIWNTPFMEKSPHKGYSIPQSEYAMTLIGRKTDAYEPVVSDDIVMYLPDNIKKAIIALTESQVDKK